jgi:TolA-binding protein
MKFFAVFLLLSALVACTQFQNPVPPKIISQGSHSQEAEKLSESLQQVVTSKSTTSYNLSLLRVSTREMTQRHRVLLEQQNLNIQNFSTEYQQFTVLNLSIDELYWLINQPFVVRVQMIEPARRR